MKTQKFTAKHAVDCAVCGENIAPRDTYFKDDNETAYCSTACVQAANAKPNSDKAMEIDEADPIISHFLTLDS